MMRRFLFGALVLSMSLAFAGTVLAGNIKQFVRPDKQAIILTGENAPATEAIDGYYHALIKYSPDYKGKIEVLGGAAAVVTVVGDKVTDVRVGTIDDTLPTAPAIPANGYVLYGAGRGYVALSDLKVGDAVQVVEKASIKPAKLPTKVVTSDGDLDITAFDRGRAADELIIYTADYGTKTWTNEWGFESLVVKGEVIAQRAMTDTEPFAIPANGWVVSGHGAFAGLVQTLLAEGATVEFK